MRWAAGAITTDGLLLSGETMQILKEQIVRAMRERGDDGKAQLAEQQLPDKVDLDKHADRLARIGIAPRDLSIILASRASEQRERRSA